MAKATKRPSKAAKAAKKIVAESKLLTEKQVTTERQNDDGLSRASNTPRTSAANKPRPNKKRG